ncbi:hypothetical protein Goarm_019922 [Gossypium armourianum]|uniref:Uncharacterized protein n=1 Tax=Gossypium armourianum TaxID=34283 RepID=A0A7J9IPR7_9ROSI|nr:hypothetical protein [Gossypium armourianum]
MMKNMIPSTWIIFSTKIRNYVSLWPQIKQQQNSFK